MNEPLRIPRWDLGFQGSPGAPKRCYWLTLRQVQRVAVGRLWLVGIPGFSPSDRAIRILRDSFLFGGNRPVTSDMCLLGFR